MNHEILRVNSFENRKDISKKRAKELAHYGFYNEENDSIMVKCHFCGIVIHTFFFEHTHLPNSQFGCSLFNGISNNYPISDLKFNKTLLKHLPRAKIIYLGKLKSVVKTVLMKVIIINKNIKPNIL